ncbi:hypothetical protein [Shinella zoogloeoides]|uniref:Uncharacterized protein n=1 Tax=Shinella zoogloeoides TaxID=352475 RepID=A0A6N8TGG4_SHIZO|nr:hypothetical protein [Shinella zoogloeoides]MXO02039.1 hypothetical protein [Shinella zoogloeoides]UEX81669.1 hypothetical protein K8M09_19270 [Shinella zoogloeoides]
MTDLAVQLLLAALVPALLVCAVPQRWLKRVMIGWLVAPVFVFFAVIIWEVVTGPPIEDVAGRVWSGLTILGSIFAAPWIAISMVGFGIGHYLRRLFGRSR